ncbi:MAG: hypothetical protein ACRERS_00465 [Methylococcales bacterium]
MDMTLDWTIIGIFVIGFMGVLCYGLAVLNQDLEEKRDHDKANRTKHINNRDL